MTSSQIPIQQDQSSGSTLTMGSRHHYRTKPIASKRVSFYKSGDPQFSALHMVINSRTFKTFDALLDSLSKKVPLPFGVRNITTPHGVHPVRTLEELEDGKAYICSDQKKVKPFDLEMASRKLPPWYHARPISARSRTLPLTDLKDGRFLVRDGPGLLRTPKRLTVFRNGDPGRKHTVILARRTTATFHSLLDHVSEVLRFHVVKLYTSDGRRVGGHVVCLWQYLPGVGEAPSTPFTPHSACSTLAYSPYSTGFPRETEHSSFLPQSNSFQLGEVVSPNLP